MARRARQLFEWSATVPCCRECSSTERPHLARGYCTRCYYTVRQRITGGHERRRPATTITRTCPVCEAVFTRTLKQGKRTFCSKSCASTGTASARWTTRRKAAA